MSFAELGLSTKVLQALAATGYEHPTCIQEKAIPHVLAGRDIIGIARTGTGKTASFILPVLNSLEKGRTRARMPRVLIIEPTRELAAQVHEKFELYGCNHNLNIALLIGGVSFGDQLKIIDRGSDVLIATPGRLMDHFNRGHLLLSGVDVLIIDEADRLLDMGFVPDIEEICRLVTSNRQTLFFSATMAKEIKKLADTFLKQPVLIEASPANTTSQVINQQLISAPKNSKDKRSVLRQAIDRSVDLNNGIIFCNRKSDVKIVEKSLASHNYSAVALHGDMDQQMRLEVLERFKAGDKQLLVASNVAARGLDLPEVSHVFNFDVPHHPEDYIHRIGRTGRAGRSGYALTIVTPEDKKHISAIEKLTGEKIPWQKSSTSKEDTTSSGSTDRKSGDKKRRPAPTPRYNKSPEKSADKSRTETHAQTHAESSAGIDKASEREVSGVDKFMPEFLLKPIIRKPTKDKCTDI